MQLQSLLDYYDEFDMKVYQYPDSNKCCRGKARSSVADAMASLARWTLVWPWYIDVNGGGGAVAADQ
jgi:hypothetical protein